MQTNDGWRLFRLGHGAAAEHGGRWRRVEFDRWDDLFAAADPVRWLAARLAEPIDPPPESAWRAPLESQEVWAAGVTYYRSRTARIEESATAGGGDFYDRVYEAARPELFFKATAHRTAGPGGTIRIRRDSRWNVPEPELTLCVSAAGRIFGYTIGNDLSSRDIEGENPLYLPQAKVYDGCCALGPCLWIGDAPLPETTSIALRVRRGGTVAFAGETDLGQMKRRPEELVAYLFCEDRFPRGCLLLTGTGIVPPPEFSLERGDVVEIEIPPIGILTNVVG